MSRKRPREPFQISHRPPPSCDEDTATVDLVDDNRVFGLLVQREDEEDGHAPATEPSAFVPDVATHKRARRLSPKRARVAERGNLAALRRFRAANIAENARRQQWPAGIESSSQDSVEHFDHNATASPADTELIVDEGDDSLSLSLVITDDEEVE
jgi:hypothetical protein